MDNLGLCYYNGKVYEIIYNFKYQDNDFTICRNDQDKLVYFKHTINEDKDIYEKDIYTPFDRWICAFELGKDLKQTQETLDNVISRLNSKKYNLRVIEDSIQNIGRVKTKKIKMLHINRYVLLLFFSIITLIFGGITIYNWYDEGQSVDYQMGDILKDVEIKETVAFTADEIPEVSGDAYNNQKYGEDYWKYMQMKMMSVDFDDLIKQNPDTRGWIYINNTNVNYPFVQSGDNSYYLNHSFDRSYNVAGWLFADYKSTFDHFGNNTVIYGHGRVDQVMFGSLQKVLNEGWYSDKENQIIKISTPEKNTLWQIFSIYTIPAESYYLTHTFENEESFTKFIDTMKSRSIYNFGINVDSKDKLLTISTCLDTNGNRIVMQAKLIKEQNR